MLIFQSHRGGNRLCHRVKWWIAAIACVLVVAACRNRDEVASVPSMPSEWKVKFDEKPSDRERTFLEVEGRLKGKIEVLRVVIYEVQKHQIRLNIIVASDISNADRIYRNLAFQKQSWAYTRKGKVIYEFGGPEGAKLQIEQAIELIKAHPSAVTKP